MVTEDVNRVCLSLRDAIVKSFSVVAEAAASGEKEMGSVVSIVVQVPSVLNDRAQYGLSYNGVTVYVNHFHYTKLKHL